MVEHLTPEEKIAKVLEEHEAFTVIRYKDDDKDNRLGYQCKCGEEDSPDGGLWGRAWLVSHLTREIVRTLWQ
jgi:hypothetical protein